MKQTGKNLQAAGEEKQKNVRADGQNKGRVRTLFVSMFKIGCVTFGGGWSIITQMQEEFIDRRGWMTEEELLDDLSLAKSFPGIMIINVSVMTGYAMAGVPGALAAAFGLSLPALLSISLVTVFYAALRDNVIVAAMLNGVRCAVIPIIIGAAIRLGPKSLAQKMSPFLCLAAFFICTFTSVNLIYVVLAGALAGFLSYYFMQRKKEKS